jgi:hypothetical protein
VKERFQSNVTIMALAVTDNVNLVRKQHADMRLPFPILDGKGLHLTFGVDATPRLVVLDGEGYLRAAYTGWGDHIPREINAELQRWIPSNVSRDD